MAAAGREWAKKVFPGVEEDWALQKLWDAIYHATRMDMPDPQKPGTSMPRACGSTATS